jgi:hypothetical protein
MVEAVRDLRGLQSTVYQRRYEDGRGCQIHTMTAEDIIRDRRGRQRLSETFEDDRGFERHMRTVDAVCQRQTRTVETVRDIRGWQRISETFRGRQRRSGNVKGRQRIFETGD